ncbi:AH/BAR [Gracilaria domingensis]|nr:AH/BAR [Gracilaria domingensis]
MHLAQRAERPQSPPAGDAYAADIHAVLARWEEGERDTYSDGVIDRSDVTLFPAAAQRSMAAGVFVVRSRRNWTIVSTPTQEDYYLVRRSIADFLWLHDCLSARNEGVIVPLLPPLSFAGRVKHGYAYEHERLRALETFLRRVATHAVLSTSEELLAFLGALGEDEWLKIRREAISHESSITSALFGSSADENAWHRLAHWGEKMLWQTGRRFNKALVWFLERDGSETLAEDSAEARVERLHTYVKHLGVSLAFLRHATEKVHKQREAERNCAVSMQNALRELGTREGGKLGSQLEQVRLEIPPEGELHFAAMSSANTSADPSGDARGGASLVPANRVFGPHLDHGTSTHNSLGAQEKLRRSPPGSKGYSRRVSFAPAERPPSSDDGPVAGGGGGGGGDLSRNGVQIALPVARVVDDVFRDYEERAKGAQRIMNARREEQDAYEHAVAVYTKLRDQLESRTGSMWDGRSEASNEGLEGLKTEVNRASNRLKEIRERYKKVALSTTDELRRLRNDMHEDLCEALHGMAVEYARQHAAHAEAWTSLAQCVNEFRKSSKTTVTSSPQSGSASRSRI